MLYDSTKALLQSILHGLESSGEILWDDESESGKACLYEMHQMSRPLYRAYRIDGVVAKSGSQGGIPEKLSRAMPHVKSMVIAIRMKDRAKALESGRSAIAVMNDVLPRRLADDARDDLSKVADGKPAATAGRVSQAHKTHRAGGGS